MVVRDAYHWEYCMPSRDDRPQLPFQMRDVVAALYLITALRRQGYVFKDSIFNFPADGPGPIPVDGSFLDPDGLVVVTTRMPLNDQEVPERRISKPSNTTIERKLFQALKK